MNVGRLPNKTLNLAAVKVASQEPAVAALLILLLHCTTRIERPSLQAGEACQADPTSAKVTWATGLPCATMKLTCGFITF